MRYSGQAPENRSLSVPSVARNGRCLPPPAKMGKEFHEFNARPRIVAANAACGCTVLQQHAGPVRVSIQTKAPGLFHHVVLEAENDS